jgi:histidinol-phosphate/aromatic aminotransferase/cobyric acid decarboxylase-like protein
MTYNKIANDVLHEVVHRTFTKAFGLAKFRKVSLYSRESYLEP